MDKSLTLALTACALILTGSTAYAADKSDAPEEHSATWTVTEAGQAIGVEVLKTVVSASQSRFGASQFKPSADDGVPLVSHLNRKPNGTLRRYRRAVDKRKGAEVIAFYKKDSVRIVGKNSKRPPAELPGAASYVVWDEKVWTTTWEWVRAVKGKVELTLPYIDIERGRTGRLTLTSDGFFVLADPTGAAMEVRGYKVTGLPPETAEPLMLFVDSDGRLVAARRGTRAMLLKGWLWELPRTPAPEEADATGTTDAGAAAVEQATP